MTPAEHYLEAERLLGNADYYWAGNDPDAAAAYRQTALVHATLALALAPVESATAIPVQPGAPAAQDSTVSDAERWPQIYTNDRTEVINGLRALLELLETHPDLPAPDVRAAVHIRHGDVRRQDARATIDAIAAILGETAEEAGGGHYVAARQLTDIVSYTAVYIPPTDDQPAVTA